MLLLFRFLSGFFFYVQFACVLYASGALSAVKLPSTYPDPSLWPDRDYVILFPSLLLFIALSHITHKHSHAEYYVTNPLSSWFQYWNYPNAQLQRILSLHRIFISKWMSHHRSKCKHFCFHSTSFVCYCWFVFIRWARMEKYQINHNLRNGIDK